MTSTEAWMIVVFGFSSALQAILLWRLYAQVNRSTWYTHNHFSAILRWMNKVNEELFK